MKYIVLNTHSCWARKHWNISLAIVLIHFPSFFSIKDSSTLPGKYTSLTSQDSYVNSCLQSLHFFPSSSAPFLNHCWNNSTFALRSFYNKRETDTQQFCSQIRYKMRYKHYPQLLMQPPTTFYSCSKQVSTGVNDSGICHSSLMILDLHVLG